MNKRGRLEYGYMSFRIVQRKVYKDVFVLDVYERDTLIYHRGPSEEYLCKKELIEELTRILKDLRDEYRKYYLEAHSK